MPEIEPKTSCLRYLISNSFVIHGGHHKREYVFPNEFNLSIVYTLGCNQKKSSPTFPMNTLTVAQSTKSQIIFQFHFLRRGCPERAANTWSAATKGYYQCQYKGLLLFRALYLPSAHTALLPCQSTATRGRLALTPPHCPEGVLPQGVMRILIARRARELN